jgi:hypothetical protein
MSRVQTWEVLVLMTAGGLLFWKIRRLIESLMR